MGKKKTKKAVKPKKIHWATKLKQERDLYEGKLTLLFLAYNELERGVTKTERTFELLEWCRTNLKFNHMTIQRKTFRLTGDKPKVINF